MPKKIQSYELQERLGIGGMGIVHKATHIFRKETVAIKSLNQQYCHDPQLRERFKREAAILNKLDHPNIVRVLDFIEEPDELHLVMEFVEGRTLDKIIGKEVGPIPASKALPIFLQILEGVKYAHSKGVIHRDLKPSNIIVTLNGKIKVTDFGIAKFAGDEGMTKTGTKMGTLYYMSPEQIRGEHIDEQSDIYSLGMTLYEMLAGRLPFDRNNETSEFKLMNQIVNEEVPNPRKFYPGIPEWLVKLIDKAIAKKKEDRIKSVSEFISIINIEKGNIESELEKIKGAENPDAKKKSNEDDTKKQKQLIIGGTVVGVAVIVLLVFFLFINGSDDIIVEEKPYEDVLQETPNRYIEEESNQTTKETIAAKIEKLTLTIANIDATDTSWVFVIVDGKSTEDFLLPPKLSRTIKANNNFYFTLGNSGIIKLILNGEVVDFEKKRGAVRYFKLDINGLERVYNPHQLSNE